MLLFKLESMKRGISHFTFYELLAKISRNQESEQTEHRETNSLEKS